MKNGSKKEKFGKDYKGIIRSFNKAIIYWIYCVGLNYGVWADYRFKICTKKHHVLHLSYNWKDVTSEITNEILVALNLPIRTKKSKRVKNRKSEPWTFLVSPMSGRSCKNDSQLYRHANALLPGLHEFVYVHNNTLGNQYHSFLLHLVIYTWALFPLDKNRELDLGTSVDLDALY